MAVFSVDFSGLPDTEGYTNPDLTISNGTMAVRNGRLQPSGRPCTAFILNTAEIDAAGIVDVTITAGFSSGTFPMEYAAVGIFDPVTLDGLVIRFRFNEVRLFQRAANGTITGLGDFTNVTYAVGDTFTFRFNPTVSPARLVSYRNGVFLKGVDSPIADATGYKAGMFMEDLGGVSTNDGFRAFTADGIIAAEPEIVSVNGGGDVTQYQQSVSVTYADLDPATITAMTLDGAAVTYDALGHFNAPGNLATGSYELAVTGPFGTLTATVPYLQTHPIQVPPAGTSVHLQSIFGQMGNPGGRYISVTKPALLEWIAPHASFTASNCDDDIATVVSGPHGDPDGTTYAIEGSLIDHDGVTQAFTFNAELDTDEPEPPPPVDPGDWPFGLNLSWLAPSNWTWGGRHPKTNQRVRKWMGQ